MSTHTPRSDTFSYTFETVAHFFAKRNSRCSAKPIYLAVIVAETTLSFLGQLEVYIKVRLQDIAHHIYKHESAVEYT